VDTLATMHPELMERMDLHAEDLAERLLPWDSLTLGVEQLLA
jgi:hypothetical protein